MKKIKISLIIALLAGIVFSLNAYANFDDTLYDLGYISDSLYTTDSNSAVSRKEAAYTLAELLGAGKLEAAKTKFTDVEESDSYSGYIQFAANMGYFDSDTKFNPEQAVTAEEMVSAYARLAGFDSLKTDTKQNDVISIIGLNKGINTDASSITKKEFIKLTENLFNSNIIESEYKNGRTNITIDKSRAFMSDVLGLSVYRGTIISSETNSIQFTVERNVYTYNNIWLGAGTTKKFVAGLRVNGSNLEHAPVTAWVNEDGELLHAELQNNADIIYGTIDTVNGDNSREAEYSIKYINTIYLLNDKKRYNVDKEAILKYNNAETTDTAALTGRFAKLVIKDSKVVYIESWDMTEGGILTSIEEDMLIFTKGTNKNQRIRNYDDFTTKRVFIDGRSADIKELKTDSVFDYFISDDTIIINVSEKNIIEKLVGYGTGELEIGGIYYSTGNKVYFSVGSEYKEEYNNSLSGCRVKAYFGPDEYVRYVTTDVGMLTNSRFYGAVLSVFSDTGDFDDCDWINVRICRITPDIKNEEYRLSKKVKYGNGADLNCLINKRKNLLGEGIFVFKTSPDGIITEISKPNGIYGINGGSTIEDCTVSVAQFVDNADANVTVNGKRLYLGDSKIVSISNNLEGDFTAQEIPWTALRNKVNKSTMKCFGSEDGLDVELAVLCGNVYMWGSQWARYGVITKISECVDDDDLLYYHLNIICNDGEISCDLYNEKGLLPDGVSFENIKCPALISFQNGKIVSKSDLIINVYKSMEGCIDEWETSEDYYRGTVEKVTDRYILFTDGDRYYINPSFNFVAEYYNESGKFEFSRMNEIQPGDTVWGYLTKEKEFRAVIFSR